MSKKLVGVADVEMWLSNYIKAITVEDMGQFIMVTKEYDASAQGKEVWRGINDIVRDHGGEWVSAGRGSHWRFSKTEEPIKPQAPKQDMGRMTQTQLVHTAINLIEQGLANLKEAYKTA